MKTGIKFDGLITDFVTRLTRRGRAELPKRCIDRMVVPFKYLIKIHILIEKFLEKKILCKNLYC